jgi:hypothetical protein
MSLDEGEGMSGYDTEGLSGPALQKGFAIDVPVDNRSRVLLGRRMRRSSDHYQEERDQNT